MCCDKHCNKQVYPALSKGDSLDRITLLFVLLSDIFLDLENYRTIFWRQLALPRKSNVTNRGKRVDETKVYRFLVSLVLLYHCEKYLFIRIILFIFVRRSVKFRSTFYTKWRQILTPNACVCQRPFTVIY